VEALGEDSYFISENQCLKPSARNSAQTVFRRIPITPDGIKRDGSSCTESDGPLVASNDLTLPNGSLLGGTREPVQ
jgi:hypothetical protein